MATTPGHNTTLLRRLADGDEGAYDQFFPIVYAELHRLAERLMNDERRDHTLQPTALVHEVYLRLVDDQDLRWNDRAHFRRIAARAMRRVLVDSARKRGRDRRGGGRLRLELDLEGVGEAERGADLVALDEALERLALRDPTLAQLVELRFFGGLHHQQVAEVLDMSLRGVERHWSLARAWLNRELAAEEGDDARS